MSLTKQDFDDDFTYFIESHFEVKHYLDFDDTYKCAGGHTWSIDMIEAEWRDMK